MARSYIFPRPASAALRLAGQSRDGDKAARHRPITARGCRRGTPFCVKTRYKALAGPARTTRRAPVRAERPGGSPKRTFNDAVVPRRLRRFVPFACRKRHASGASGESEELVGVEESALHQAYEGRAAVRGRLKRPTKAVQGKAAPPARGEGTPATHPSEYAQRRNAHAGPTASTGATADPEDRRPRRGDALSRCVDILYQLP